MAKSRERAKRLPDLQALLVTWQARLRLLDWHIQIGYGASDEPDLHLSYGHIGFDLPHKRAQIRILTPHAGTRHDVERTLLHELLHLHFVPITRNFSPNSPEEIAEEQAINCLVDALMGDGYEDE